MSDTTPDFTNEPDSNFTPDGVYPVADTVKESGDMVWFGISNDQLEEAIKDAISSLIKDQIQVNAKIVMIVNQLAKELVPQSPMFDHISSEIKTQLERYPAVISDQALKTKIAVTILDHMSGVRSVDHERPQVPPSSRFPGY